MREGHAREYDFYRKIMEWLEAPKVCPRRACRRASKCTVEWVPCFEAAMPFLQEHVLPGLRAAILARRGNPDA